MLNNIYHWLLPLSLIFNLILDNTLSSILFAESKNKSDQRGYNNKKFSRRKTLKVTQSLNNYENKEVVIQ